MNESVNISRRAHRVNLLNFFRKDLQDIFAFPEERQKVSTLFEGGTTSHTEKVVAFFPRLADYFLSLSTSVQQVLKLNANIENLKQNVYNLSRRLIAFCQLHLEAGRAKK